MSDSSNEIVNAPITRSQRKSQKRRQKRHAARVHETIKVVHTQPPPLAQKEAQREVKQTEVTKEQEFEDDTLLVSYDQEEEEEEAQEFLQEASQEASQVEQPIQDDLLIDISESDDEANGEANSEASVALDVAESVLKAGENEGANVIGRFSTHNRVNWAQFSLFDWSFQAPRTAPSTHPFQAPLTAPSTHPSAQWQTQARTTQALWAN